MDPERAVSRKHAEANYQGGKITLRDLGSTNGTTVNGDALQLQVECELQDGDVVSLGGFEVAFASAAKWPRGVKAEWPPEPKAPLGEETMVYAPEETAILRPADETAIMPASAAAEAPAESELAEAGDVYTPPEEAAEAPAEDGEVAMGRSDGGRGIRRGCRGRADRGRPYPGIDVVRPLHQPSPPAGGRDLPRLPRPLLRRRPGGAAGPTAGLQPVRRNPDAAGVAAAEAVQVPPTAAYATPDPGQAAGFPPPDPAGPGAAPSAAPPLAPGDEKKKRWPF